MALQSYPLIGLDWSRNEYPFEWVGASPVDAATRGGETRGFIEVLSGDRSGRRYGGRRQGMFYRKPLWKKPDPELAVRRDGKSQLATAIEETLTKSGATILGELRKLGYSFHVARGSSDKLDRLVVDDGPQMTEHVRNEIKTHRSKIVSALLEEEAAKPTGADPADPYKGHSRHEVTLKMLKQMPSPFTREDFAKRLTACGYPAFAQNVKFINNAFTYCTQIKLIDRLSRGKYTVTEKLKQLHIKHDEPKAAEPVVQPPQQAALPIETPVPPIPTPPAQVAAEPTAEEPLAAPEALQEANVETVPRSALQALFTLAADAAALKDDESALLAKNLREKLGSFETVMLDAVAAVQGAATALISHMEAHVYARAQFKQTFLGGAS